MDLTQAVIVTRLAGDTTLVERTAAEVLAEEIVARTGVRLEAGERWPAMGWAMAVTAGSARELHGRRVPARALIDRSEGYGIATDMSIPDRPVLWIVGADGRGALFGVGRLLRTLECRPGSITLREALDVRSAPQYPIRGHQLGYRAQANSYDAWTPEQFDRYVRELALFGSNCMEGIPFQDERPTVSNYPRDRMNVDLSRICERYGQAYWIWAPADFDLADGKRRARALEDHERLFHDCPVMTGVFVAGGDPGDNPPRLVIPYLRDLAAALARHHPAGRVWLSMQGYSPQEQDEVYCWIDRDRPAWLGGLVAGPSSPPLAELRARLPRQYALRDYPDITHSVRCQFPAPWWDPAYAFTLGRECVNPRPVFFARVFRDTAPFTNGFISYSDGVHDDLNKVLWSALAWDSSADLNRVVADYCRLFFGPDSVDQAAAGVFALERNWDGALATNGGVEATFVLWHDLERRHSERESNWRWQMCLLRAYYDAYTRSRLRFETTLEEQADAALLTAREVGSGAAIERALATLRRADTGRVRADLAARVEALCEQLYRSIGLQTSVAKYHASDPERGAVLDFLHYPLNNRWWMEDELAASRAIPDVRERIARLEAIARWEAPGPGSSYDDIGNIAKSPHEVRCAWLEGPLLDMDNMMTPGVMWWIGDNPLARVRQSWVTYEDWPTALKYTALDPAASYAVETTGCGDCLLRVNGVRLAPVVDGRAIGERKRFLVPRGLYRDGAITVTFDPTFEPHLNWRQQSRLTEIWLVRTNETPPDGAG